MKATGIVRKVDDLGRVAIPREIRRSLGIGIGDPVEFYVDDQCVIVKKYDTVGSIEQLLDNLGRNLQMRCELLTTEQCQAILGKMEEMKEIIKGLRRRAR